MKAIPMQILFLVLVAYNITAQTVPVKIDLISNGNKLNAKFYPVERGIQSPTVILLGSKYPGTMIIRWGWRKDSTKTKLIF